MKVERVFELLRNLEDLDSNVQDLGTNILNYVFQDVYRDYFDVAIAKIDSEHNVGSSNHSNALRPINGLKSGVEYFLDGNESIITYFNEMITDNKIEFINYFRKVSDPYFKIIKNHYYDSKDFRVLSVTFNLYAMLAAYHFHKDDFNMFKTIVDDVDFPINCDGFYKGYGSSYNNLKNKKIVIDALINTKSYLENKEIRSELRSILEGITSGYRFEESDIEATLKSIKEMEEAYDDYLSVKEEFPDCTMLDLASLSRTVFHTNRYSNQKSIRYHKYFLLGNRFNYMNNTIGNYLCHEGLINDFVSRVLQMDFKMFNEETLVVDGKKDFLNKDFFIKCISAVLDSDTFEEVNRKLCALSCATELYCDGEKEEALSICDKLSSDDYKMVKDGKIFGYDVNTINVTNKPISIGDRTIEVYRRMYPNISNSISSIMRSVLNKMNILTIALLSDNFDQAVEAKEYEAIERARQQERDAILREQQRLAELNNALLDNDKVEEEPAVVEDKKEEAVPQKRIGLFRRRG